MDLKLNPEIASAYHSPAQRTRVITEHWVERSVFCPNCGRSRLQKYPNNTPVADFRCDNCAEDFELKSKKASLGRRILDGAYDSMIKRLNSNNAPNFFLLSYNRAQLTVKNLLVVPKHFFVQAVIEKRRPLPSTARRAGWIGCNILLEEIPHNGKIHLVRDGVTVPKEHVLKIWKKTLFLREGISLSSKGWILDIMKCIDSLNKRDFTLEEMYRFEADLKRLYPENYHIKDKIRQQLQVLRDKGYIEFVSPGTYRLR